MLNFLLVLVGVFIAAFYIVGDIGSITIMNQKAALIDNGALLDLSTNKLFSPIMIFTTSLAWGLGTAANPQYIIRITSAKSKKIGMQMICMSVIVMGILYLGLIVIGIGARVIEPTTSAIIAADEVLPYIINNIIYSKFSGVIFLSVIAAAISTANSQLLLLASSFTYDIYMNIFNKKMKDEKFISLARVVIFVSGTISLLLSINPPDSLLLFGSYIWSIFAVTFMMPLYGGLYWKKATRQGAVWSTFAGIVFVAVFYVLGKGSNPLSVIHPVLPGLIASFVVFYTVSKFTYKKTES